MLKQCRRQCGHRQDGIRASSRFMCRFVVAHFKLSFPIFRLENSTLFAAIIRSDGTMRDISVRIDCSDTTIRTIRKSKLKSLFSSFRFVSAEYPNMSSDNIVAIDESLFDFTCAPFVSVSPRCRYLLIVFSISVCTKYKRFLNSIYCERPDSRRSRRQTHTKHTEPIHRFAAFVVCTQKVNETKNRQRKRWGAKTESIISSDADWAAVDKYWADASSVIFLFVQEYRYEGCRHRRRRGVSSSS